MLGATSVDAFLRWMVLVGAQDTQGGTTDEDLWIIQQNLPLRQPLISDQKNLSSQILILMTFHKTIRTPSRRLTSR